MLRDRVAAVDIYPPDAIPFKGQKPFRVEGVRLVFSIKKDLKKGNEATIDIYNLGPSVGKIWDLHSEIQVFAGYAAHCGLLRAFNGDITTVTPIVEGPNRITRITAKDGWRELHKTTFSASYAAGTSSKKVLDDAIGALGLPKKFVKNVSGSPMLKGFAHFGPASKAIDKLTAREGLEWSVQDRHIQVLEEGEGNDDNKNIVLLTPTSGLIGSPERLKEQKAEGQDEDKLAGWKVRCLLNPDIRPGSWVSLQCQAMPVVTAFRVDTVEHKGDTHGQDWESTVELRGAGIKV